MLPDSFILPKFFVICVGDKRELLCNQNGYCTGLEQLLKKIFGVKYSTLSQSTFDSAIRNFNIYGFSIYP